MVAKPLIFALRASPKYVSGAHLSNEDLHAVPIDTIALSLEGADIDDHGVEALPLLSELRCLDLDGTRITDRCLASVARMPDLEELWLEGTGVTDTGMLALRPLRRLGYLSVAYTAVTEVGIAALREAVPALEVSR
jgi:hypothetical protein